MLKLLTDSESEGVQPEPYAAPIGAELMIAICMHTQSHGNADAAAQVKGTCQLSYGESVPLSFNVTLADSTASDDDDEDAIALVYQRVEPAAGSTSSSGDSTRQHGEVESASSSAPGDSNPPNVQLIRTSPGLR